MNVQKKMLEIFKLALEISKPEEKHDDDIYHRNGSRRPEVFVEFAPHISGIDVCIYPHGWSKGTTPEHYCAYANVDNAVVALDIIIYRLRKILKEVQK